MVERKISVPPCLVVTLLITYLQFWITPRFMIHKPAILATVTAHAKYHLQEPVASSVSIEISCIRIKRFGCVSARS
jgi:hypothetical protein